MVNCEMLRAELTIVLEAITDQRARKIAASQRGASPEELAQLEEDLYDMIWLYMAMSQILGGLKDE